MRLGDGTLPALDLVYYQEAQYSRLLPVTTRRYVTLPVTLNGQYIRYTRPEWMGSSGRKAQLSAGWQRQAASCI